MVGHTLAWLAVGLLAAAPQDDDKAAQKKAAQDKAAKGKAAQDKAERDKAASERAAQEKADADKAAEDKKREAAERFFAATFRVREEQYWDGRAQRNRAALEQHLAPDYREIFPFEPRPLSRADLMGGLSERTLTRHVIVGGRDKIQVERVNPQTVVLTYDIDVAGSLLGRDFQPQRVRVTSWWTAQGNDFITTMRQGTFQAPAVSRAIQAVEINIRDQFATLTYRGLDPLEDVHVTLTLTFDTGATVAYEHYWGTWKSSDKKEMHLPVAGVHDIERADLTARATRDGVGITLAGTVRR